ncbi:hypothetical protein [Nitrospira moscoviensis]|uniref:Flagellar protein FliT n=1 Tax=Nitrospira moscoviensis TaxID=42253 RepID=A0A0K2GC82_NITMO|nr:hypothetical protein [Nitrospira moscoviensis]ALA58565.1 hypothetical protein NITMOv2_2148 [Nitrospira moscoviensis]
MTESARRAQWTEAARTAAAQGRWDIVRDCYQRREQSLADEAVTPEEAARLLAIDREIHARAQLAQTVLASSMRDAAAIRQRLAGLRRGQGAPASDSRMILLQA